MFNIRKFLLGIKLVPTSTTAIDSKGEIEVLDSSGKVNYHNGTTASPLVTESHSSVLTNKTIDADLNTLSNIENADIKAAAAIDASKIANGTVSNAEFQFINSVTSNVQDQIDGKQSSDATLTALAVYNTNGLVTQTGADTFTGRTIVGTTNQVSVANGDGVAANPTLSLPQDIHSGATPSFAQVALGGDPSSSLQAATKQYVDAIANGLKWKASVLIATTANITLSGEQTIDGVLTSSSRVLVKNQSTASENGIYVSNSGAWVRSVDADSGTELVGASVFVEQGTVNLDKGFIQTSDSITIGVTAISWIQNFGTGTFTADGQGIELSGSTFSLELDGSSLSKSASGVKVNVTGAPVGTTDTQVLTNKDIDGGTASNTSRITVPRDTKANLDALTRKEGTIVYATDTDKFYSDNGSILVEVGTAGTVDVDVLMVQDFDSSALGDFTQTGLSLNLVNPIKGTTTARLIHQPATSQSFKQVKAVDRKFRGFNSTLGYDVRTSATSGNLTLLVRDETNAADLYVATAVTTGSDSITATTAVGTTISGLSNSDVNKLKVGMTITGPGIQTATVINSINTSAGTAVLSLAGTAAATVTLRISALPAKQSASFDIPANCSSISYTFTALQEATLVESYIDDVVIRLTSSALTSTSVTTPVYVDDITYAATTQGLGAPTTNAVTYTQIGDYLLLKGRITLGTVTGSEVRIGLPFTLKSTVQSNQQVGTGSRNVAASVNNDYAILATGGNTYLNVAWLNVSGSVANVPDSGTNLFVTGNIFQFECSVRVDTPSTVSKTIPLTSAVLVSNPDSLLRVDNNGTATGVGSTATGVRRFAAVRESLGSDVTWLDDSVNGSRFQINKSGTYAISFTDDASVSSHSGITKNSTTLAGEPYTVANSQLLSANYMSTAGAQLNCCWTGYLVSGDIIRAQVLTGTTVISSQHSTFSISKQGSLTQVNPSSDQKIEIPTSELRFEGASARGGTDTAIVKFDSQTITRGDAFSVVNSAANGTVITVLKSGVLSIQSSFFSGGGFTISKNQSTLTAIPIASESLAASEGAGGSEFVSATWVGTVKSGDVLRISSTTSPTANARNVLTLLLQEQKVQVSLSNVLPQWTEGDSVVQLSAFNGYGATNTRIVRLSNTDLNLGTDITYTDSATLGASFVAASDGIFSVAFAAFFTTGCNIGFTKNSTQLTTDIGTIFQQAGNEVLMAETATAGQFTHVAWSGKLLKGDILRIHGEGFGVSDVDACKFSMSKVGKPNITGVNVTPFVNIPQRLKQEIKYNSVALTEATGEIEFALSGFTYAGSQEIISVQDDPANTRTKFVASKKCRINIAFTCTVPTVGNINQISKNGVKVMYGSQISNAAYRSHSSGQLDLEIGDYITLAITGAGSAADADVIISAEAEPDAIVAQNKTFRISELSLTRVTATPTKLGEYRSFQKGASTFTGTDTAPGALPSSANGFAIGAFNYATAGSGSFNISRYEIFIGLNKAYNIEGYVNAARSRGWVPDGSFDLASGNAAQLGTTYGYDPSSGLLVLDCVPVSAGVTSNSLGWIPAATAVIPDSISTGYFDIIVSDNPLVSNLGLPRSEVAVDTGNGKGSTNTALRRFTNIRKNVGNAITYADSATLGASFTINEDGVYSISYSDVTTGADCILGVMINTSTATGGTLTPNGVSYANGRRQIVYCRSGELESLAWTGFLVKNDVVSLSLFGGGTPATDNVAMATIVQVSK